MTIFYKHILFSPVPQCHTEVKVNFDGCEELASAGVLCGNERGIVLLVKGRMLAGFTVPLQSWLQRIKRFEWRSLNCMLIVYGLKEIL